MNEAVRTPVAQVASRGAPASHRWSTEVETRDRVIVAATSVMALVTVWAASPIISVGWDWLFILMAWSFVGVGWTWAFQEGLTDRYARIAAGGLLLGSCLAAIPLLPSFVLLLWPEAVFASFIVAVLLVAVVIVREPRLRVVRLVAPAIVALTIGLALSGIPRYVRFAAAEAALTAYVTNDKTENLWPCCGELIVAGVPIHEVIRDPGQVRLVTGFIGMLGDDPAGLLYRTEGAPTDVGSWEHIKGPWYRWYPRGYPWLPNRPAD
jgi:hypothetical protein